MPELTVEEMFADIVALQKAGRLKEAYAACHVALPQSPEDIRFLNLMGILCLQLGATQEGLSHLERSLKIDENQPQTLSNYAIALEQVGRVEEALTAVDKSIDLRPDYVQAYANRANFLSALDQPEAALAACDKAFALGANFPAVYANRGNALRTLMRFEESLADYDVVVQMSPNSAIIHNNRGNVLKDLGRLEEALGEFNKALELDPKFPDAWTCRGNCLRDLCRYEEAIADHDRALALQPDYASAKWNKALVSLLVGDFETGWDLFEARWHGSVLRRFARKLTQPLWQGEDLSGKSILIYAEQGLGDTVQFCRYVPMFAALGARVVFEVQPALKSLMKTLPGAFQLFARGEVLPETDYQCPLMSLPRAFKTRLETIPGETPYLSANPKLVAEWAERLPEKTKPRIGLAWSGKAGQSPDLKRSMPAEYLGPLMDLPVEFHCLQKEIRPADVRVIAKWPIATHQAELEDFADTAALIAQLDLVIAVDTSVAHVAGALGKPVWLLLPWANEWRWLLDRTDSPWYPGMCLFRQPRRNNWADLIAAAKAGLMQVK